MSNDAVYSRVVSIAGLTRIV